MRGNGTKSRWLWVMSSLGVAGLALLTVGVPGRVNARQIAEAPTLTTEFPGATVIAREVDGQVQARIYGENQSELLGELDWSRETAQGIISIRTPALELKIDAKLLPESASLEQISETLFAGLQNARIRAEHPDAVATSTCCDFCCLECGDGDVTKCGAFCTLGCCVLCSLDQLPEEQAP